MRSIAVLLQVEHCAAPGRRHPRLTPNESMEPAMKVLFAIDNSRFSAAAARYLAKHPELLGDDPDLLLMNVDPPLPLPRTDVSRRSLAAVKRSHEEASEAAMKPIRAALRRARIAWREQSLVGDPAATIVECAQTERCDLIAMGSHGSGALRNLFLESVTSKVIADSKIPVLIVR